MLKSAYFQVVMVATLLLGACAKPTIGADPSLQVVQEAELPEPTRADFIASERPYLVGPFDKLKIDVFGVEQLQEKEYQIDASGRLSFPFAGTIAAGGLTPQEISAELANRLRDNIIRDPQVTVNLMETISRLVTVEGAVRRPGRYPVIGEMTLLRTIAVAEGTTDVARLETVLIFREVDGRSYAGAYDLKAIRQGNYPDPEVYPNDVVVVGDSATRRLFRDLSPLLVSPLVVLLQGI